MQLHGLHHLTAVSADARGNRDFYTRVLGMRLVKKTVNQDDVSAYHLFYADGLASPGTDLTFFDFPTSRERRGTNSIVGTGLRLAGDGVFDYWAARLDEAGVPHGLVTEANGRPQLDFEDLEGQRLTLVDDGGAGTVHPWARSAVPEHRQIRGLGPVTISVAEPNASDLFLAGVLSMRRSSDFVIARVGMKEVSVRVYEMGEGGPSAELHVRVEPDLPPARSGAGGAHHVAFRVHDEEYTHWVERLETMGTPSSGPVDRFYFRSLYTRGPGGILYEIATEGPGFTSDEPLDSLGERLSLPPFLENRRAAIERNLKLI